MNALVRDQLRVLRTLLKNVPEVRFGRYINIEVTPEREAEARELHPDALDNEVVSREVFRRDPPHILITNFAMLEYLLLRRDDDGVFRGPWRFFVLDETHVYRGARGTEMALLIRRLRWRLGRSRPHPMQFIATSATLGGPEQRGALASFASRLFDAQFEEQDIIMPTFADSHSPTAEREISLEVLASPELTYELTSTSGTRDWRKIALLLGASGDAPEKACRDLVMSSKAFSVLKDSLRDVPDVPTICQKVFGKNGPMQRAALLNLLRLSTALLDEGSNPLLSCRFHMFVRGLTDVYASVDPKNPQNLRLYPEPVRRTSDGFVTFRLHLCRECGQPYLLLEEERFSKTAFPLDDKHRAPAALFLPPGSDNGSLSESDLVHEVKICLQCGLEEECVCNQPRWVKLKKVLPKGGRSGHLDCPVCQTRDSIAPVRSDSDALQTVITDAILPMLPPSDKPEARAQPGQGRKLLAFADSRQDAAFFAPYLQQRHNQIVFRQFVLLALEDFPCLPLRDFFSQIEIIAQDKGYFRERRLPEGFDKRNAPTYFVSEFCIPLNQRFSLESLALAYVEIDLSPIRDDIATLAAEFGVPENALEALVQMLLAIARRQMAVPVVERDENWPDWLKRKVTVRDRQIRSPSADIEILPFLPAVRTRPQAHRFLWPVCQFLKNCDRNPDDAFALLEGIWEAVSRNLLQQYRGGPFYIIGWDGMLVRRYGTWYRCERCGRFTPFNAASVCPHRPCQGNVSPVDPEVALKDNHYRRIYTSREPLLYIAREHTAQVPRKQAEALQEAFMLGTGRHRDPDTPKQVNILSCSTTFELGVDLGDLDAVFLRNVPPDPANYAQRAGRAGRRAKRPALCVTFVRNRSHDLYWFERPVEMIRGAIKPPTLKLDNPIIARRHITAVLLSRYLMQNNVSAASIGNLFEPRPLLEDFARQIRALAKQSAPVIGTLWTSTSRDLSELLEDTALSVREAIDHYQQTLSYLEEDKNFAKKEIYRAINNDDFAAAEQWKNVAQYLDRRISSFKNESWITFLADRNVLPRHAFPIYNVTLRVKDDDPSAPELKRDLNIAISEYAPGARLVAVGKHYESLGVTFPGGRKRGKRLTLPQKFYTLCRKCWFVASAETEKQLISAIGAESRTRRRCPVCGERLEKRRRYWIPQEGFWGRALTERGRFVARRPRKILSSIVHFVPSVGGEPDETLNLQLPGGRIQVFYAENANFFVYNPGEFGAGFILCEKCGRALETELQPHETFSGRRCNGKGVRVHLAHEFLSSAVFLRFHSHSQPATPQEWLSVLFALLRACSVVLDVEEQEINGVVRPVKVDERLTHELILYDDVPGGAGFVENLCEHQTMVDVLQEALRITKDCDCAEDAACYRCLLSYRNLIFHPILSRSIPLHFFTTLMGQNPR